MHIRLPILNSFPFLGVIMQRLTAMGGPSELRRTHPDVAGQVARDLGVTVSELYSLAANETGKPGELLDKRLDSVGLRKDELARIHPEVLRDLEHVCGRCASTTACAKDFARANGAADIPKYCPNELTLQALRQEKT